jgi:hypothetical protein
MSTHSSNFGNVRGADIDGPLCRITHYFHFPLILLVIAAGGHILERRHGTSSID